MTHKTYMNVVRRWEEVTDLPPQTLGPLTRPYKKLTKRLKVMPWPWLLTASLIGVIGLYIIIGPTITYLVSLLQIGF